MYYCIEMVRIENNSHMLGITCKVAIFSLLKTFLALIRLLSLQLGLFRMKHGAQHYSVYIIVLKWLDLKMIGICLMLSAKLRFQSY